MLGRAYVLGAYRLVSLAHHPVHLGTYLTSSLVHHRHQAAARALPASPSFSKEAKPTSPSAVAGFRDAIVDA